MIETLQQGWRSSLTDLFNCAQEEVTVASPFISLNGARFMIDALPPDFRENGCLNFVSDLSPRNVGQGATDPHSFRALFDSLSSVRLYHLPRLHAKVYVRDQEEAIVTSGNLTDGGVFRNFEYGLRVDDPVSVKAIRRDLLDYAALGAAIDQNCINEFCKASDELRAIYLDRERAFTGEIEARLKKMLGFANDKLIASHLAGNSLHAILRNTIIYLLKNHGNLRTVDLHLMVKEIHPDLCDDTVDRVINGVHFGKKWKHAIRSAQSGLKRNGLAELRNGKWTLLMPSDDKITYWFKPIGSIDEQVTPDQSFFGDNALHFSKTKPKGVKPNDIIITYAVGTKFLLSAYRVDSQPLLMSNAEIRRRPRLARWPWYVKTENLTPTYGAAWHQNANRYDDLVAEYVEMNPKLPVVPSGKQNLDALFWGKDKLRLSNGFAIFLLNKLSYG